jgi:hypothetical protein
MPSPWCLKQQLLVSESSLLCCELCSWPLAHCHRETEHADNRDVDEYHEEMSIGGRPLGRRSNLYDDD